jgi:hypothetical protein
MARAPTIPARNVPMVRRLIAAPPYELNLAAEPIELNLAV